MSKQITIFFSMMAAFFFGGYKTLIGLAANADIETHQATNKSLHRIDINILPRDVKESLQHQIEGLKQNYAEKNLNELIFGVDENGNLQIIGTQNQIKELESSIRELQDKANSLRETHPSSG